MSRRKKQPFRPFKGLHGHKWESTRSQRLAWYNTYFSDNAPQAFARDTQGARFMEYFVCHRCGTLTINIHNRTIKSCDNEIISGVMDS